MSVRCPYCGHDINDGCVRKHVAKQLGSIKSPRKGKRDREQRPVKRRPSRLHLCALRCTILRDLVEDISAISFSEIYPGLALLPKELNSVVAELNALDLELQAGR